MDTETKKVGVVLRSPDEKERKEAASVLGKATGGRKAEAAVENGRLGGRPPGGKDSEETRALKSQRIREALARKKAEATTNGTN